MDRGLTKSLRGARMEREERQRRVRQARQFLQIRIIPEETMTTRKKWQITGLVIVAVAYLGGMVGWAWAALSLG